MSFACPHCNQTYSDQPNLAGREVVCRKCNGRFSAPLLLGAGTAVSTVGRKPANPPPLPMEIVDRRLAAANQPRPINVYVQPGGMSVAEPGHLATLPPSAVALQPPSAVACPYCKETIIAGALKCKHCGEILDPALREARQATAMVSRAMQPQNITFAPQMIQQVGAAQDEKHNALASAAALLAIGATVAGLASLNIAVLLAFLAIACAIAGGLYGQKQGGRGVAVSAVAGILAVIGPVFTLAIRIAGR